MSFLLTYGPLLCTLVHYSTRSACANRFGRRVPVLPIPTHLTAGTSNAHLISNYLRGIRRRLGADTRVAGLKLSNQLTNYLSNQLTNYLTHYLTHYLTYYLTHYPILLCDDLAHMP